MANASKARSDAAADWATNDGPLRLLEEEFMSTFNYYSPTWSIGKWELGLVPRLISAAWFAIAACVPVIFFFSVFGGTFWRNCFASGSGDLLTFLWLFGALPIS